MDQDGLVGITLSILITCAIGCAVFAKRKNKSAFTWFFLGQLLGPLSLWKIGFMEAEESEFDLDERFRCPSCAEMVLMEAKVCRYCGRDLPEKEWPSSPEPAKVGLGRRLPKLLGKAIGGIIIFVIINLAWASVLFMTCPFWLRVLGMERCG